MRLEIRHHTRYFYDEPVPYGLQQLRLTPTSSPGQHVIEWDTTIDGGERQLEFGDHHGNRVSLISIDSGALEISITTEGTVETGDLGGVYGDHDGEAPLWLFTRDTPLTKPKRRVRALVESFLASGGSRDVASMHELSREIGRVVSYVTGTSDVTSTAEQALKTGSGVCQDHAHIFISVARSLGLPARYVSGYLLMEDRVDQAASHAWAEVWLDDLGWVGFDVSNGISPDERYVRIATGLDYRDAAPIAGLRFGGGNEGHEVSVRVQLQAQQ